MIDEIYKREEKSDEIQERTREYIYNLDKLRNKDLGKEIWCREGK